MWFVCPFALVLRRQSSSMHRWLRGELYLFIFFRVFLCVCVREQTFSSSAEQPQSWDSSVFCVVSEASACRAPAALSVGASSSAQLRFPVTSPSPAPGPAPGHAGALRVHYESPRVSPGARAGGTGDALAPGHVAELGDNSIPWWHWVLPAPCRGVGWAVYQGTVGSPGSWTWHGILPIRGGT